MVTSVVVGLRKISISSCSVYLVISRSRYSTLLLFSMVSFNSVSLPFSYFVYETSSIKKCAS
jgi:hypothetical protein